MEALTQTFDALKSVALKFIGFLFICGLAVSGGFAAFHAGSMKADGSRPAMVDQAESVIRENQNWIFDSVDTTEREMNRKELADHLATELAVREIQNSFQAGVLSQYGYAFDWQNNLAFRNGEPQVEGKVSR